MHRFLLTYYGDDFTGSTDVMESLCCGGVPTVLFVEPPTTDMLAQFPHARACGIAGNSRTMSPSEMERDLHPALAALAHLHSPVVHYKTCSTFDSAPEIGSIGKAIELGRGIFPGASSPLVVGAPALARYCVFGNLFARSGLDSQPFRLDRHPTMQCHPVTPMAEADLTRHLASQTSLPIELVDVLTLNQHAQALQRPGGESAPIVLFDALTDEHLQTIGRWIWRQAADAGPLFVAGSSGMEAALVSHWRQAGIVDSQFCWTQQSQPVPAILVVSGSCSPVTARQIDHAVRHGFQAVAIDTRALATDPRTATDEVVARAREALTSGQSVIAHTCLGPTDRRLASESTGGINLGAMLADIVDRVLTAAPVQRVAVTGGDTSGQFARALGIDALEMVSPLAPGSPLCRVHSNRSCIHGLEITFKGGQVGHDDFLLSVREGGRLREGSRREV